MKKGWTVFLGFGWCGFGWRGGLRLGVVRFDGCRGWIGEKLATYRCALAVKVRGIGG